MRIVFDTNVLIAALISRGFCHELLEHCVLTHTLVTSDFILDEVREKLVGKLKYSLDLADEAKTVLRSRMQVVVCSPLSSPVSRDPDDDNVLATALAGDCECIITGDGDLLVLKEFENIKIVSPRQFFISEEFR